MFGINVMFKHYVYVYVYVYLVVGNRPTLLGRDIVSLIKLDWANV